MRRWSSDDTHLIRPSATFSPHAGRRATFPSPRMQREGQHYLLPGCSEKGNITFSPDAARRATLPSRRMQREGQHYLLPGCSETYLLPGCSETGNIAPRPAKRGEGDTKRSGVRVRGVSLAA